MRSYSSAALVLGALIVGCGCVAGHQNHGHGGKEIPLHEREYVQDPVEELERKWSFEVSSVSFYCILHSRALAGSSRRECLFSLVVSFPKSCLVLVLLRSKMDKICDIQFFNCT
jgi:hypothetical protein